MFEWIKNKFSPLEVPPELEFYAQIKKIDLNVPIENHRFVVLDTETTGFDIYNDRIVEIGAIGISNLELDLSDHFNLIVKQDIFKSKSGQESIGIHEILQKHSEKLGESENEAILKFMKYLQGSIIIAHHAKYDFDMLNSALKRNFKYPLHNKIIDTVHLAKKIGSSKMYAHMNSSQDLSLDALCEKYKIEISNRHTAGGDAFITGLLFVKLIKRLKKEIPKLKLKSIVS